MSTAVNHFDTLVVLCWWSPAIKPLLYGEARINFVNALIWRSVVIAFWNIVLSSTLFSLMPQAFQVFLICELLIIKSKLQMVFINSKYNVTLPKLSK